MSRRRRMKSWGSRLVTSAVRRGAVRRDVIAIIHTPLVHSGYILPHPHGAAPTRPAPAAATLGASGGGGGGSLSGWWGGGTPGDRNRGLPLGGFGSVSPGGHSRCLSPAVDTRALM